jgi:hypothetical protein
MLGILVGIHRFESLGQFVVTDAVQNSTPFCRFVSASPRVRNFIAW